MQCSTDTYSLPTSALLQLSCCPGHGGHQVDIIDRAFPTLVGGGRGSVHRLSQGAILRAVMVSQEPVHAFPVQSWSREATAPGTRAAHQFARGGGQRVLFASGRASCLASARVAAGHLTRAGVQMQVVYAADQGHNYAGKVQEAVAAAFAWVTAGKAHFARPMLDCKP